jgi:hypothetical protein
MENLIRVLEVHWLDLEAREADVLFEVGLNRYHAYSHPCDFEPGETCLALLDCLEQDLSVDAMLSGNPEHAMMLAPRNDGPWAYDGYGSISALRPVVVACGDLRVELGDWFRDERLIGEPIYFVARRLNVFRSGSGTPEQ